MNMWFYIANTIFTVGVIPNIYCVLRNRDSLNGYSLSGSMLVLLGIFTVNIGIFRTGEVFAVAIVIPTIIYWMFVIFFKLKERLT